MPKKIVIPATEDLWDASSGKFITVKEQTLVIEHSLVSISKWESKWKKPFLSEEKKTAEELIDYIRCMTINQGVDDRIYSLLPMTAIDEIYEYISDKMTATVVNTINYNRSPRREVVTSELIYYKMLSYGIPYEFEKWHLNRLITLIQVFDAKNQTGGKKLKGKAATDFYRSLNEQRLAGGLRG